MKELEQFLESLEAQKRMRQQQQLPDASATAGCTVPADAGDHNRSASLADVDVTLVDSHANLKVLSLRRPQQLLQMVTGLQGLRLTTLHLNVTTTVNQMVFYSFSLKACSTYQPTSLSLSLSPIKFTRSGR